MGGNVRALRFGKLTGTLPSLTQSWPVEAGPGAQEKGPRFTAWAGRKTGACLINPRSVTFHWLVAWVVLSSAGAAPAGAPTAAPCVRGPAVTAGAPLAGALAAGLGGGANVRGPLVVAAAVRPTVVADAARAPAVPAGTPTGCGRGTFSAAERGC